MKTKRDEMEMLLRWQQEARKEGASHLARLMTDAFVQWVGDRLTFDQSPDMLDALETNEKKVFDTRAQTAETLEQALVEAKVCPMLPMYDADLHRSCLREECAWWGGRCAVQHIGQWAESQVIEFERRETQMAQDEYRALEDN